MASFSSRTLKRLARFPMRRSAFARAVRVQDAYKASVADALILRYVTRDQSADF
jgi:hypothetical protein